MCWTTMLKSQEINTTTNQTSMGMVGFQTPMCVGVFLNQECLHLDWSDFFVMQTSII